MHYNHDVHSNYKIKPKTLSNAIITQTNYHTMHDIKSALITATHQTNCRFLFEIPADLFGNKSFKAAVFKLNVESQEEDLAFILMNEETGVLHIIGQKEAPLSAVRFVKSYAKVLAFLQQTTETSH